MISRNGQRNNFSNRSNLLNRHTKKRWRRRNINSNRNNKRCLDKKTELEADPANLRGDPN